MSMTESCHSELDGTRRFTIADVAVLPSELPSGPARYELDNGRLVVFPAHTSNHASVSCIISAHLMFQGHYRGHGKARGSVGIVLWRNPDRLVVPDAAFITNASLPVRRSPEDYLETIPELIVEVRSPN